MQRVFYKNDWPVWPWTILSASDTNSCILVPGIRRVPIDKLTLTSMAVILSTPPGQVKAIPFDETEIRSPQTTSAPRQESTDVSMHLGIHKTVELYTELKKPGRHSIVPQDSIP